jgi:phenylacetic acid degradation operon negative regulatory protein
MTSLRRRSKAQHLLITILGDYWRGRPDHIPSAALVKIMKEVGVGAEATRSALSRLVRRGLLARSRHGRRTSYGLTRRALNLLEEGAQRIFGFGAQDRRWGGAWSIVAFSVAEKDRARRHRIRAGLRWLSFAPLYDAMWISPHAELDAAARLLDELGVKNATLFKAEVLARNGSRDGLIRAWNLDELRGRYESYIKRFRPVLDRLGKDAVREAEALVIRTEVMDAWRKFPKEDPDLPTEFLSADWPRREARQLFVELFNGLAPMAERHVRKIVAETERDSREGVAQRKRAIREQTISNQDEGRGAELVAAEGRRGD